MLRFSRRPLRAVSFVMCLATGSSAFAALTKVDDTGDIFHSGLTINSTATPGAFPNTQGLDTFTIASTADQDNGLIFFGTESFNAGAGFNDQRVAITGFNSPIIKIRLHTYKPDNQRVPGGVIAWSSTTSKTSLSSLSYETLLGNFSLGASAFATLSPPKAGEPLGTATHYVDLTVAAPANTKTLFLDFSGSSVGARITELQAYAPEPATLGLLAFGGLALIRRRRN